MAAVPALPGGSGASRCGARCFRPSASRGRWLGWRTGGQSPSRVGFAAEQGGGQAAFPLFVFVFCFLSFVVEFIVSFEIDGVELSCVFVFVCEEFLLVFCLLFRLVILGD